jgi:O-antigen ligase
MVAEPPEEHPLSGLAGAALILFCALLFLTASFGRAFSKVGWDAHSIYVTEIAFAGTAVLAFAGLGPRVWVNRIGRLPLIAVGVYWLAGAIATMRGIAGYGLSQSLHDVGLLEYSGVLVLVAVVIGTSAQADWLLRSVVAGGAVAILFFACASAFGADTPPWKWATIGSAATSVYIAGFVCAFAAAVSSKVTVPRWWWPLAWAGMVLIWLTYSRAAWVALVVVLVVLVGLSVPRLRLRFAVIGTALLVTAGVAAVGAEKLQISGDASELRAHAEAVEQASTVKVDTPNTGSKDTQPDLSPTITQATRETFSNNISEQGNSTWRLAIWKYDLKKAVKQPVFGVGFGKPTAFHWDGHVYDGRSGNGLPEDVSGPHNSFVNIIFRMGLLGFGALLALAVIAARRVWPWIRDADAPPHERAVLVGSTAVLVFTTIVASLNVSLEGPFMGIFWWLALALMLVLPQLYGTPQSSARRTAPS